MSVMKTCIVGFWLLVIPCMAQSQQNALAGKWFFTAPPARGVFLEFTENEMTITSVLRNSLFDDEEDRAELVPYHLENNKIFYPDDIYFDFEMPDLNTLILRNEGIVFSCRRMRGIPVTALSGTFVLNQEVGIIREMRFIDERRLELLFLLGGQAEKVTAEYEIRSPYLIIKTEGSLSIMEILEDFLLRGDPGGFGGDRLYIKVGSAKVTDSIGVHLRIFNRKVKSN